MAGCSPGTRRRAFGERESLEIKNGERGGLEIKDEERESFEIKDGERESLESKRFWRASEFGEGLESNRVWRPRMEKEREDTWREERGCRVQKEVTGRRRILDAAVNIRLDIGGKKRMKDKRVKLELWTLDSVWRVSAGRPQKGNNGSRRPYISPQYAGRGISQSITVSRLRSVEELRQAVDQIPSKHKPNQVNYEGATTRRVVESSTVGAYKEQD
ncbi:uncharacterized protein LOC127012083 [Drosophila biarmipes]|uniref:uncharacterized protein LOC127012083 n=1 Tax=Drosophila biarmipes TaxID=125945 RepID=UPI0021CC6F9B|nr:uncharacterized protein LOC127012083 [Drosophila biarmipes]